MALKITNKEPQATACEWHDFTADVSFLIDGIDNEQYRIGLERARRLIAREDDGQSLKNISVGSQDRSEHDIQCELMSRFILRDWKGAITDENDKVLPYTQENAYSLLKNNTAVFLFITGQAITIERKKIAQIAESVKKPVSGSNGKKTGTAKAKSRS